MNPLEHDHGTCCRRDFLKGTLSCGAYTLAALAVSSAATRKAFAQARREVAVKAPFAQIESISDGVWAVVSTPISGDLTTISNGGIIAGDDVVLVIEGFQTTTGAAWLRDACIELTGRAPTHVALTHYHPDHSNGLGGYLGGAETPEIISTAGTRDLLLGYVESGAAPEAKGDDGLMRMEHTYVVPETVLVDADGQARIDLGGKQVTLRPHVGHTPSDMTITLDDPNVVWCGDLFFNGLFPNYRDAVPGSLTETCKTLLGDASSTYVPGHGSIANDAQIANYLGLLDTVEAAAREGLEAGKTPAEIAAAFELPDSLGSWFIYDPNLFERAFDAWQRELA